ncbi:MAG: T9SS type A sorting domain-containing protein [Bacteroidia bacterium]
MKNKLLTTFLLIFLTGTLNLLNAAAPTTQASNVQISWKSQTGATITWTRGNGSACMVVMRLNTSAGYVPASPSTTNYSASSNYGSGSTVNGAIDNYIVYKGTGNSIFVTNLGVNTLYDAYVYEYNISGSTYYYNTNYASSSVAINTIAADPSSCGGLTSAGSITNSSATLYFNPGGGSGRMITVSPSGSSASSPSDGYYYAPSAIYGNGGQLGAAYSVYTGSGTSATVTGLTGATTYNVYDYEYVNGTYPTSSYYNYNSRNYTSCNSYSFSTTNIPPTISAISNISVCENSGLQFLNLYGISDGSSNENQSVTLSATSSNPGLIANPGISYSSPNSTALLIFSCATGVYGSTIITVTVDDGWSSNNTAITSFIITVNPFPSAAGIITGPATVCAGGANQVYSISPVANATGYDWTLPAGWVISGGSGTNSINVSIPASAAAGNISVYGTSAFGCGNGASSVKAIAVDQLPTVAAAGPDQVICSNTTQLQGNNPTVGTGSWSVYSGSAGFNNASQYNTNITGIANGQTAGVQWTISNGVCPASSDQVSITYDVTAPQCQIYADFFTSNSNPCTGSTITFTDNSVGATGWNWNFGTGASPANATGAGPHTVSYASTGQKTISLNITGPNGADNETKSNYIDVIATPGPASAISGANPVCAGSAQVLYSVNPIAGATIYVWTFPPGVSPNTGNGTSALSADFAANAGSGSISVAGQNACGTGTVSTLSVTVNPLPGIPSAVTGNDTVCQGQTGENYAVAPVANASSYTWIMPPGANITFSNANQVTVDYTASSLSGNIQLYGTNSCGNGDTAILPVLVNPLPGDPIHLAGQSYLTRCPAASNMIYTVSNCANATGYIWTLPLGGSIITGDSTTIIGVDFLPGSADGSLTVTAINSCGSSDTAVLAVSFEPAPDVQLCAVSVDTASVHNEIHWTRPVMNKISYFKIYRKVSALVDLLVDSVVYAAPSEITDTTSGYDPNTTSYEYTISAVDSCGYEWPKAPYHQTMFMQTSLGAGTVNLSWNLYVGQTVNFYRVYRDSTGLGNWELLTGTVPPASTAWTDNNPPVGISNLRYLVDVDWLTTCDPSRGAINTSRSNIKTNSTVGIKENAAPGQFFLVYPNPSHGQLTIELKQALTHVGITVYNSLGELIYSEKAANGQNRMLINTEEYASGIYTFILNSDKGRAIEKIVIE